jgi:hypothetical protein
MKISKFLLSRRDLMRKGGALSAGLAALALPGFPRAAEPLKATMPAAVPGSTALPGAGKDVDILNTGLSLEHQIIASYQMSIDSGILQNLALNIAMLFQSHHKAHRDAVAAAVQKLGGTPVASQSAAEYGAALGVSTLKSQNDILQLALKLELASANAYLGFTGMITDKDYAKLAARVAADDVMHWTALASTLSQPLPANPLTFGA